MKIELLNDQQLITEAFNILIENLEPAKVARFWEICNLSKGDYIQLKERIFAEETVDSLYEKIKAYESQS